MGYITKEGLNNLKNYKYVSGGYSFVDNIMNKYWWENVITVMPMVNKLRFNNSLYFRILLPISLH